jgi:nucleotide-binding universal stress UspA family protein|nr:universal stress protein [Kofleriaceae bacterium]
MSIVCGTDLSAASAGALEVARALAAQRGDRDVILVHVIDSPDGSAPSDLMAAARAGLDAQAAVPGTVAVRTELVVGSPDEALVGFAETDGSDLVVIAARSTGGSLLRLGSTAERVIQRTHVPVLVIREAAPWLAWANGERPLKVMIGIDDSATSDMAIQWTQQLRRRGPVDVVLGAIYYPDETAERYGLPPCGPVDLDPELEKLLARDLLKRFGETAGIGIDDRQDDTAIARPRRGLGRIGDHLVELAREDKVDAIVVGTSQKTGLNRLGSVSSIIVHDAPESVICVPPNAVVATAAVPSLRSVLVATDLSAFANRAVPYAFTLAPSIGAVHLVHVIKDDAEAEAAELAKALRALVPTGATQTVQTHVVRGDDAAAAIAQIGARLGVDVICVASHGRSGISRALVGSVADRLLRVTRLPVLVLRPAS